MKHLCSLTLLLAIAPTLGCDGDDRAGEARRADADAVDPLVVEAAMAQLQVVAHDDAPAADVDALVAQIDPQAGFCDSWTTDMCDLLLNACFEDDETDPRECINMYRACWIIAVYGCGAPAV